MGAAFVLREAVDLVDDDVLDGAELLFELRGVEQDRQRLRRGVEHVWRGLQHRLPVTVAGVTVPDGVTEFRLVASFGRPFPDAGQRHREVPVDVVCQRLQRRDVQTVDAVVETVGVVAVPPVEFVDHRTETGERLPAPCRATDECVRSLVDQRDRLPLGRGEEAAVLRDVLPELVDPPLPDRRRQPVEHRLVGQGHRCRVEVVVRLCRFEELSPGHTRPTGRPDKWIVFVGGRRGPARAPHKAYHRLRRIAGRADRTTVRGGGRRPPPPDRGRRVGGPRCDRGPRPRHSSRAGDRRGDDGRPRRGAWWDGRPPVAHTNRPQPRADTERHRPVPGVRRRLRAARRRADRRSRRTDRRPEPAGERDTTRPA